MRLPGDLEGARLLERIIRVDHAGEFGAKRIYEGQMAFVRDEDSKQVIHGMYTQELEHLQEFERLLQQRQVKPTALMPLWNVAGFALGAITAILGKETAMACTAAVEEVIDEHYGNQLALLPENSELKPVIEKFRADEVHHRDIALERQAEQAPFYPAITAIIKKASRTAIWLSERI